MDLFGTLTFAEILGRTTFLGTLSLTVIYSTSSKGFEPGTGRQLTTDFTSQPSPDLAIVIGTMVVLCYYDKCYDSDSDSSLLL
jgi:hypothetical protein